MDAKAKWNINDVIRSGSMVMLKEVHLITFGTKTKTVVSFDYYTTVFSETGLEYDTRVVHNNEEIECFFDRADSEKIKIYSSGYPKFSADLIPDILKRDAKEIAHKLRGTIVGKKFGL